jgi:hypothetical protein
MVLVYPTYRWQRFLCGILAVLFAGLALMGQLPLGWSENTSLWLAGTFGKLSIVLAMVWLAWPQLMWIQASPGGSLALAAVAVAAVIFVAKPRLLLYVVPWLVGGTLLLWGLAWLQRLFLPPK